MRRMMSELSRTPSPLRASTTRRLESDSVEIEGVEIDGYQTSWAPTIWDPAAQLQPMVMVIDDSPAVRRVVEICLARQGISTCSFSDGVEAMAALSRNEIAPPKILLLDIGMPRMNGYEVARNLRANSAFRGTRIFMLTGHDGMLDRAYARMLGAGFIAKPFKSHELIKTVLEALDKRIQDDHWR